MAGITAGYHRYFSHRSYKTGRAFQFVLAWVGCSAAQKGPLWWAAHHRHHHLTSDTPADRHSPVTHSFWRSHVGWILVPDADATDSQAVRDLDRYPELRWLDRHHWVPPLALAGLCFLVGGWSGLVWGFLVSTILCYHATFTVNSLCHLFGRRRYATGDESRNNLFVALLTLGEGWHNNHHHYQVSARQGFFWWEVDITYYVLRALAAVGLIWDLHGVPDHIRRAEPQPQPQPAAELLPVAALVAAVPPQGTPDMA
jgi:stearoyl-CoA desaturase (delta-9 desaturase)